MLLFVQMLSLALAAAPSASVKQPRLLPILAKEPKLDGSIKDLAQATELKVPASAATPSAALKVKAAFRKDTLWLGVRVNDNKLVQADELSISLYFPKSGAAHGYFYRFGTDGALPALADNTLTPAHALESVKAVVTKDDKGLVLEAAFPFKALPRFPARSALALNICVDYLDDDEGTTQRISSCEQGDMAGGAVRLPDEFRKIVKLVPPPEVETLEPRANGVVGFGDLHYPTWGYTDGPMTPNELRKLIAGLDALDPQKVKLPISDSLTLPDTRPLYSVLTGHDPYDAEPCDAEQEVRLAMYGIKANVATRVLEWPAITCGLGRALSIQLSPEGHLEIGYSNGTVAHFAFSNDHFERSELGVR